MRRHDKYAPRRRIASDAGVSYGNKTPQPTRNGHGDQAAQEAAGARGAAGAPGPGVASAQGNPGPGPRGAASTPDSRGAASSQSAQNIPPSGIPKKTAQDYARENYGSGKDYRGARAFDARERNYGSSARIDGTPGESATRASGSATAYDERGASPSTPRHVASAWSATSAMPRYATIAKRQRKRRRIATTCAAVAVALVLVCVGIVGGINKTLHQGLDSSLWDTLTQVENGQPFYMLLMGTDESTERDDDPELAGLFRTDTIILARIDPQQKSLTLVSIPRDTKVDLGEYGDQKINAAHTFGGATLAVQAVEQLTGVSISHYAEVDFDGFIGIVDTIGGIEVDVPMTIDDEDAGGHLDAGLQTLNAEQALILCRSRNSYENVVGQGDLYRAANQRLVLAAIVNKILSSDPVTMAGAINSCAECVNTDLDVTEILSLANSFRGFDSSQKLYSATFPVTSEYSDDIWWDIAQLDEWSTMRERMDEGLAPYSEDIVDSTTGTILATAGDSADESESTTANDSTG